eukprot:SM000212S06893  [mRNA]  locus=s212:70210:73965:- [translate_table: standard]
MTTKPEVHYVHGELVLRDGKYISSSDIHMKLEGVYIRPYGQLRVALSSAADPEVGESEDGSPYHMARIYHLPLQDAGQSGKSSGSGSAEPATSAASTCGLRLRLQVSPLLWESNTGLWQHIPSEMLGSLNSPNAPCFAPLDINVTAVNLDKTYNKAVNYTLMVTFISFLQVLFLIRQMEHSNTQSGAAKVSLLMIGQQAVIDAYLCLLHLTAGIVVESLFNAFATAAFFKFVIFSIFEMRYLLAIWKATRPAGAGEGWNTMRRELSVLYSRFYGFLLGGILLMYQLHGILRYILLLFYCFWIPQIVSNVLRDTRKPLHPHYILGITITRLAIPLYTFGCPKNFMRVEPSAAWCITLIILMASQATVLLLQHYFGSRCFVPRQFLPEKYSYFRRVEAKVAAGEASAIDCVICMAPVDHTQQSMECMVTPCDHFFHTGCLQRWMDIKMECPTCRRPLPPM